MRFGLVGYGAWGRLHAQCIAESAAAELAAVCCNSDESTARTKTDYPEATERYGRGDPARSGEEGREIELKF